MAKEKGILYNVSDAKIMSAHQLGLMLLHMGDFPVFDLDLQERKTGKLDSTFSVVAIPLEDVDDKVKLFTKLKKHMSWYGQLKLRLTYLFTGKFV